MMNTIPYILTFLLVFEGSLDCTGGADKLKDLIRNQTRYELQDTNLSGKPPILSSPYTTSYAYFKKEISKSQIIWPPESVQRSGSENIQIDRDVFESSFLSKSTSLIPSFAWKNVNTTENTEMFPKEIAFHGKTMNAMALKSSGTIDRSDTLTRWALSHPKCATNVTSYVGQTAKMHCCLARLDRDLSVSWIRKNDVVVLSHGNLVFTSDERVKVSEKDGIWALEIQKVGHTDQGVYECQTNTEVKTSVSMKLNVMETQAKIEGEVDHFVKVGSTLRLTCRVYLGNAGPDDIYAKTAVIHWFHNQRLLDPDLENWKTIRAMSNPGKTQRGPMHVKENLESSRENTKGALKKARRRRLKRQRLLTKTEVNDNGLLGILEIRRITPYDTGNYSCVPSYALPDWAQVHIVHDEKQNGVIDGVSEVKIDASAAKKRGPENTSKAISTYKFDNICLVMLICSFVNYSSFSAYFRNIKVWNRALNVKL